MHIFQKKKDSHFFIINGKIITFFGATFINLIGSCIYVVYCIFRGWETLCGIYLIVEYSLHTIDRIEFS